MKWTTIALLLALAACGGEPLTIPAGGPPPSTFTTPPPAADQARAPEPTAQVVGTVTP